MQLFEAVTANNCHYMDSICEASRMLFFFCCNFLLQVLLHVSEARALACQLTSALGMSENDASLSGVESLVGVTSAFRFSTFLAVLEAKCIGGDLDSFTVEQDCIDEAITDMYNTYLYDVIKKGPLLKRGYLFPTLREYWFVLQPTELSYYKAQDEREQCGTITLNAHCHVDACPSSGRDKVGMIVNFWPHLYIKYVLCN
jgi:hypothetical protein